MIYGRNLGCWATIVTSIFSMTYCSFASSSPTCSNSLILLIPAYASSVSGKCFPISPSAVAPNNASITACTATSASECPSSPYSYGISTPPSISLRSFVSLCTSYPIPTRIYDFCPFLAYSLHIF